jgi:soluble lytic murein transglycosylase-like protein
MKCYLIFLMLFLSFKSFAFCFDNAGQYYGVNPLLLEAIATVESSLNANAINKNENSLGLMQIHPQWFERLKKYHIDSSELLSNPCVNVNVGAWILAGNFNSHGKSWNSVGAYNAGFSKSERAQANRKIYIKKVKDALFKIKLKK